MIEELVNEILLGISGLSLGQLQFLLTYYEQLWIFLIVASFAVALYIFTNSALRNIQDAAFWRIAAVLNLMLFIPTILVILGVRPDPVGLLIFAYLGIASAVIALGLGIGYWINFRELARDNVGYDANAYIPPAPMVQQPMPYSPPQPRQVPSKPRKPKISAWLVAKSTGRNHQLNQGTTIIGRSNQCDIPILNDPTVSGTHAKIAEENGHFTLTDLGSTNGTWVNGYRVRQPMLLEVNDEIRLGDNTYLTFVAS